MQDLENSLLPIALAAHNFSKQEQVATTCLSQTNALHCIHVRMKLTETGT
jgi:hypothetical protein